MTRIKTTCPSCDEVELTAQELALTIVGVGLEQVEEGSNYCFVCPSCEELVTKPVDGRVARMLADGGVSVCVVSPVADTARVRSALAELLLLVNHPEAPPLTDPLTPDMLIDFHELLQTDDWFDALLAADGAGPAR